MKYNIYINQKKLVEITPKIKLEECAILDYLCFICSSSNEKLIRIERGKQYFTWVNLKRLLSDMPLLHFKSISSISERIKRLEKFGFIKTITLPESSGKKIYITLMEKTSALFADTNRHHSPARIAHSPGRSNNNNIYNNNIFPEQSSDTNKSNNNPIKTEKKKKNKDNDPEWNTHEKIYQYINELDSDGNKVKTEKSEKFKILAYYAILGKQRIENKEQWNSFVKRNIRIASKLQEQGWDCKKIIFTSLMLEAKGISWGLEAIERWLPRLDSELTKQSVEESGRYKDLYGEFKINVNKLNNKYANRKTKTT